MGQIKTEGEVKVKISDAYITEKEIEGYENCMQVHITVSDANGDTSRWNWGILSEQPSKISKKGESMCEETLGILAKLGLPNNDLSKLDDLIGKDVVVNIRKNEKDDKVFYGIAWFVFSAPRLDILSISERSQALFKACGITPTIATPATPTTPATTANVPVNKPMETPTTPVASSGWDS